MVVLFFPNKESKAATLMNVKEQTHHIINQKPNQYNKNKFNKGSAF